ncbi:OmpA family protein [Synechococcus sp. H70.2]|uniref:OmpA family protein n=2 Tax=unclassified Synechococcus TaxID=2626047 RepID=UPI0039C0E628
MPPPWQRTTVFLNLLGGLLLIGSGIAVGMVLPLEAQLQPPAEISPFSPPILPTLPPLQASSPLASPTPPAEPGENRGSSADLEAELREVRQQVIQLLVRIEELEAQLQQLSSLRAAPVLQQESSTAAEVTPGEAEVPLPTTFQVGTRTISLPGDLLFDFDKAEIRPEAASLLAEVAKLLQEMPGARVQVNGHTDNIGSLNYNLDLSLRRANAVKDYLMNLLPKDHPVRWTTSGFGPTLPVADNNTEVGRQRNRRVELVIAP